MFLNKHTHTGAYGTIKLVRFIPLEGIDHWEMDLKFLSLELYECIVNHRRIHLSDKDNK